MKPYNNFIFRDYEFNEQTHKLHLYYSIDGIVEFSETYSFDFDFAKYDPEVLRRACESLFFMAGVSYYKAYMPKNIVVEKGELDNYMAAFFSRTYQRGLGEFFYLNRLDPLTKTDFPPTIEHDAQVVTPNNEGLLVGVGGGKDLLVSIEFLKGSQPKIVTWSFGHKS